MKIVSFAISFVLLIVLLFVFFTTYNNIDLEILYDDYESEV